MAWTGARGGRDGRAAAGRGRGERLRRAGGLTVQDLHSDRIFRLATERWGGGARPEPDEGLVRLIHARDLGGDSDVPPDSRQFQVLEASQYLERFLWPTFAARESSDAHVLSICALVCAKHAEGLPAWDWATGGGWKGAAGSGDVAGDAAAADSTALAARLSALLARAADLTRAGARETLREVGGRAVPEAAPGERSGSPTSLRLHERVTLLRFWTVAFQSLEVPAIRSAVLRLCSLPAWRALSQGRRQLELHREPALLKRWKRLAKRDAPGAGKKAAKKKKRAAGDAAGASAAAEATETVPAASAADDPLSLTSAGEGSLPATFLSSLVDAGLASLERTAAAFGAQAASGTAVGAQAASAGSAPSLSLAALLWLRYAERSLELFCDLLSQLPTRRFARPLLEDRAFGVAAASAAAETRAAVVGSPAVSRALRPFEYLSERLRTLCKFPVDDHSGEPLDDDAVLQRHAEVVCGFQRLLFAHWPRLRELALATVAQASEPDTLREASAALSDRDLALLVLRQLRLASPRDPRARHRDFLERALVEVLARPPLVAQAVARAALYPTERELLGLEGEEGDEEDGGTGLCVLVEPLDHADMQVDDGAVEGEKGEEKEEEERRGSEDDDEKERGGEDDGGEEEGDGNERGGGADAGETHAGIAGAKRFDRHRGGHSDRRPAPRAARAPRRLGVPLVASASALAPTLAAPKLNLQFLSPLDYLERLFELFRLEATREVREDLADAASRLAPALDPSDPDSGRVIFRGWARAARPLEPLEADQGSDPAVAAGSGVAGSAAAGLGSERLRVVEVAPPLAGEAHPARVVADVAVDLAGMTPEARADWDRLRAGDVVFLAGFGAPEDGAAAAAAAASNGGRRGKGGSAVSRLRSLGLSLVRGAAILELRDAEGTPMNDPAAAWGSVGGGASRPKAPGPPAGTRRSIRVALDPVQYQTDADAEAAAGGVEGAVPALYGGLQVVLRRHAKENNFAATLAAVRDMLKSPDPLPDWIQDVLLGYGDPADASPGMRGPDAPDSIDFADTFLDSQHVLECFGDDYEIVFRSERDDGLVLPPFRVLFGAAAQAAAKARGQGTDAESSRDVVVSREDTSMAGADDDDNGGDNGDKTNGKPPLVVISYRSRDPGPYPELVPPGNRVRFTRAQLGAICRGLCPGLTLVVGPPGTGKTDTIVQLLFLLLRNRPDERILIVTHSNQALNDVFAKLASRDVPATALLRLGAGEADLDVEESFGRSGRVDALLARRLELLGRAERVLEAAGSPAAAPLTCETAQYAWLLSVLAPWERFLAGLARAGVPVAGAGKGQATLKEKEEEEEEEEGTGGGKAAVKEEEGEDASRGAAKSAAGGAASDASGGESPEKKKKKKKKKQPSAIETYASTIVRDTFPFSGAFEDVPGGPLLSGEDAVADLARARSAFRYLRGVFRELAELRPLELLRRNRDRLSYMLTKQARIVAMTCTHAAIKRPEFLEVRLGYDSLLMEEAAQVLEVETLVPMCLQENAPVEGRGADAASHSSSRLKRVVLVGDHNQLPPVVQAPELAQAAGLAQSMFTRLVRSGAPAVALDRQGRARPELAALYAWRYPGLGHLPRVLESPEYQGANPGLLFASQLVDVQGRGESTPLPHYYQNLDEAEHLCALYAYMRLVGYPARSVAVLTTYNGQKALLEDVFRARCAADPALGMPAAISTVDKFQGQQADYVLLSLVRTRAFGHLRDVRRAVVALSRARLGLYVFADAALFSKCLELAPALGPLLARPTKLAIVPGERYGACARAVGQPCPHALLGGVAELQGVVGAMLQASWAARGAQAVLPFSGGQGADVPGPRPEGVGAGAEVSRAVKDESERREDADGRAQGEPDETEAGAKGEAEQSAEEERGDDATPSQAAEDDAPNET